MYYSWKQNHRPASQSALIGGLNRSTGNAFSTLRHPDPDRALYINILLPLCESHVDDAQSYQSRCLF